MELWQVFLISPFVLSVISATLYMLALGYLRIDFLKTKRKTTFIIECQACNYESTVEADDVDSSEKIKCERCGQESNFFDNKIKNIIPRSCFLIIIVPSIIFMVGEGELLNFFNDPPHIWFQRSGALLVLFAAYMEFVLINETKELSNQKYDFIRDDIKIPITITRFYTHYLLFAGTLIWAYGDLIYLHYR